MSVYSTVRDSIKAQVAGISGIGQVHDYERYSADWSSYFTLFGGTNQILGWWITWDGIPESGVDGERMGSVAETYRYTVHGIMGLKDSTASEETFDDLIEAVVAKLRNQRDYGSANVIDYSTRVSVPVIETRQYGSVLAHYTEIRVEVTVVTDITWG